MPTSWPQPLAFLGPARFYIGLPGTTRNAVWTLACPPCRSPLPAIGRPHPPRKTLFFPLHLILRLRALQRILLSRTWCLESISNICGTNRRQVLRHRAGKQPNRGFSTQRGSRTRLRPAFRRCVDAYLDAELHKIDQSINPGRQTSRQD